MSNTAGSSTVDQRIVEMRIDNEKFEAGAKKTIGILESLDRSLKSVGQDNAAGFDSIEQSLDKVTDRFSAMGIVGDQVMRNLTNKAMELVGQIKNMATMLTTQQIDAGWNKYADKTQAIQTIMAATNSKVEEGFFANQAEQLEWVNEQIQKLNKFTDETSYNFLDMVGNIGKFTAAGRELEESVVAMEGIANWAAISGGRPAEASRAMYNLSQALGMGAVTQMDWKSIENANMATYEFKQQVIETAEAYGTLKKVADGVWETTEKTKKEGEIVTVETFRDQLKTYWFNSDVLLDVLGQYGEFSDILLNVTEKIDWTATDYLKLLKAFKSGDAEFQEAIEYFSLTDEEVQELLPDLQELAKAEYDLGFRAFQAAQEAKTFTEAIDATKDAVSTKWMDVFELLFGNYLEAKELWTKMSEVFWDIFASPVDHLIDIIKGSKGIVDEKGIFHAFSGGLEEVVGGTGVLEDRLSAIGKDMNDFRKALNKVLGSKEVKRIVDDYGSLEEALINGAITAEQFKKALGQLDDSYDSGSPISLNRALNKAGKTMTDFEKAIEQVGDAAALDLIENFGGVEEALKRGGISADLFKKALESLGINAENVSENIEESTVSAVASLEEMRALALEVLRGDHGNGDERFAWYEEMGLDAELMQAMAGDLKNYGYYISDEALMDYMEQYYQAKNLAARLGYETFAEYLASIVSAEKETIYTMSEMADEADDIYASLFGSGVVDAYGDYVSAGKLFRDSLTNLLDALDNFGTAFDKAFLRVFGGSDDYDEQVGKLSDGFFTLTAAFYAFSERVLAFSESDTFMNFMTTFLSILGLVGKALRIVFKIAKVGMSVVLKLLSPLFKLATHIFKIVSTGLDTISQLIDSSGILDIITEIGDLLLEKISVPVEKINYVITKLIESFKEGFAEGGVENGFRKMYETMSQLFENHPAFLTAVRAIGKVLLFLKDVVSGLALAFGSIFGGAIMLVISIISKLGEWFTQFIDWAKSSELVIGIWTKITDAFKKFGETVKKVFGYAEKGYQEGGFLGAFNAVFESFKRGVSHLIPDAERLTEIFNNIKTLFGNIFSKKTVNEDGVIELTETTDGLIDRLGTLTRAAGEAFGNEEEQASFRERIKQLVHNIWNGFLEGIREIRISDVIAALRLGVIADIVLKVSHGLHIFTQLGESIREIPENLSWTIENIGLAFKSLAVNFRTNAILKFAVAAAIVAGAIWILSGIPDNNLEKASSVVIAILTVLTLMSYALGKTSVSIFKTIEYLPALGTALIGFAASISAIAGALLIITLVAKYVGVKELREATFNIMAILLTIGILIGGIIRITKNTNYASYYIADLGKMIRRMGVGLIAIALAIQMLVFPIVALTLLQNFGVGKFRRAVLAVSGILLVLGAFIAIVVHAMPLLVNGDDLRAAGSLIVKVGAAMLILALAIQMLTIPIIAMSLLQNLGVGKFWGAIAAFGLIIGSLIAFIGLTSLFMRNSFQKVSDIKEFSNALILIAASLAIVALAVGLIAKPIEKIAKLSEAVETKHILGAITGLVITIGLLAGIMVLLSKIIFKNKDKDMWSLGEGLFKIAASIALLSVAALLLTPAIVILTAAVGAFAAILGAMDDTQWNKFKKGLVRLLALTGTMFLFGLALLSIGVGAVAAAAGIIGIALGIFVFAAAIAIVMLALPKMVDAIYDLRELDWGDIYPQLKKIASILGILAALILATAVALRPLFRLLSGAFFGKIGTSIAESISGIGRRLRNGISSGFTSAVKFLEKDENKEALIAALETIILIGASYVAGLLPTLSHVIIGGLVGLINAVSAEISAQAPEIVEALNNLVKAIVQIAAGLFDSIFGTNFLTKMTESEEYLNKVVGNIEKLILAFLVLKSVGGISGIIKKFKGLKDIIVSVKEKIDVAKTVSSEMDGAMKALAGSSEGYFTSLLAAIGPVLVAALAVAAALYYANENINEQQGILEERAFDGQEKDIEGYNAAIADTEKRMNELKEAMDNGATDYTIVQEYDALNLLLGSLISERNLLEEQAVATDNATASAESFATGIRNITDAMAFLNTVDLSEYGHTMEEINHMDDAQIVATAREIEQSIGTAWGSVSDEIQEVSASEEVLAGETENTTTKLSELKFSVSELGENFDGIKSMLAEHGINIDDFISGDILDLSSLVPPESAEQFKSQIESVFSGSEGGISEFFSNLLSGAGADAIGGLEKGADNAFPNFLAQLFGYGDPMEDTTRDSLESNSPSEKFARIGDDVIAGLVLGVTRSSGTITTALESLTTTMHNSGAQIVQGLINGISASMLAAYNTGANLAASVENGFRNRLGIQSPSKVFHDLGGYITEGVSEGVTDNQGGAIDSIVVLGDELIQAITKSMAEIGYIASDDFNISPQITPVVDMSNVSRAAGSMSSMFGGSYRSYISGINDQAANITSATQSAAAERRASNEATLGEMRIMGDRIDSLGERIANMQIVLDSGALVGATSSKIDSKLGQISARRARAN